MPVNESPIVTNCGVALAVLETTPVPTEFVAETLKLYKDPLTSPVTMAPVLPETPSAKVVQVVGSEFNLYSTT